MPPKTLATLGPVPGADGLWTARRGAARMMAVALPAGGLMLYSAVLRPGAAALDAARALGGVAALLAPSPFHHLGIPDWRAVFPDAALLAPDGVASRLTARLGEVPGTGLPDLSPGIDVLVPPGLKAPEIWLRAERPDGVVWAVCDAFAGPAGTDEAPADTPKARGAFAAMCIGDRDAYVGWAMAQIDRDRPTLLLPAHGNAVAGADLPARLAAILESL